jgi:hypothetical protein
VQLVEVQSEELSGHLGSYPGGENGDAESVNDFETAGFRV